MNKEFILFRPSESLVAVISCKPSVPSDEMTSNEVMQCLIQAVTSWVKNTQEGKDFYESTSRDANIGDLHSYGIPLFVRNELYNMGIEDLKVTIYGQGDCPSDFVYDSHVVDAGVIEDDNE